MIVVRDLYYQTPDGKRFFRHWDNQTKVSIICIEEGSFFAVCIPYYPGLLYAYGCVPTSNAAYQNAKKKLYEFLYSGDLF